MRQPTRGEKSDEEPSLDSLYAQRIVKRLRVVFRTIQEHSRWVEKQCGVSAAQLWAMWELHSTPGLRVSELSKALSIHQSTASNLLDKLESKGLIQRERGKADHRVVRLYLTESGGELVEKSPRPAQGALSNALGQLPRESLQQLDEGLGQLLATMKVRPRDAALRPLSDD